MKMLMRNQEKKEERNKYNKDIEIIQRKIDGIHEEMKEMNEAEDSNAIQILQTKMRALRKVQATREQERDQNETKNNEE